MSHKKSYKELRESIRNEVCRNYQRRIEGLQSYVEKLRLVAKNAEKERDRYREQLLKAQDENAQLKDWVERLCDYCNLSGEERQLLLEESDRLKQKVENSEGFKQFIYSDSQLFKFLNFIQ